MRIGSKAVLLSITVVVCVLVLTGWFVTTVMDDEQKAQRAAVVTAYEKTVLTKVDKVERFVSQKPYTVIQGEDKIGQRVLIWVSNDEIRSEMAANGVSAEQAQNETLANHADAKVLRTTPGIFNGAAVWEVFYKWQPEGQAKEQYFYDYYSFNDGQPVDTWRLSIQ